MSLTEEDEKLESTSTFQDGSATMPLLKMVVLCKNYGTKLCDTSTDTGLISFVHNANGSFDLWYLFCVSRLHFQEK